MQAIWIFCKSSYASLMQGAGMKKFWTRYFYTTKAWRGTSSKMDMYCRFEYDSNEYLNGVPCFMYYLLVYVFYEQRISAKHVDPIEIWYWRILLLECFHRGKESTEPRPLFWRDDHVLHKSGVTTCLFWWINVCTKPRIMRLDVFIWASRKHYSIQANTVSVKKGRSRMIAW